jgi:YidC/Oxa1 family membrane protein insertase
VISSVFNTVFYNPLYNGLVLLLNVLPWLDLGFAIIVFTIIIKFVLSPLSQKSVVTQAKIKEIEPKIKEIKEKYRDKQEQAVKTMELYKKEGINPFSGFLLILLQIPIIFALYFIFLRAGFPEINTEILYSFVGVPTQIKTTFLGIFDVTTKSFSLALIAGLTQFFQAKLAGPKIEPKKENQSLGADFARSMSLQMKYVFPVIVFFIAYTVSAAIAIYWATSNIFMIAQELYVKRKLTKENALNSPNYLISKSPNKISNTK